MRRLVVVAVLCALVSVPCAGAWTWPVDGPVLRPFAFGPDPYAAGQHRGVDIGAAFGTPVRAPTGGRVSFAGTVPGGGKTLTVQTADGYAVTLLHLGSIGVARGATVVEGEPVGTVGSSATVQETEPYLYLGVRRAADPQGYLDPLTLLPPRAQTPPAFTEPAAAADTVAAPAAAPPAAVASP